MILPLDLSVNKDFFSLRRMAWSPIEICEGDNYELAAKLVAKLKSSKTNRRRRFTIIRVWGDFMARFLGKVQAKDLEASCMFVTKSIVDCCSSL